MYALHSRGQGPRGKGDGDECTAVTTSIGGVVKDVSVLIDDRLHQRKEIVKGSPVRSAHPERLEVVVPRWLAHKRGRLPKVGDPLPHLVNVFTRRHHLLLRRLLVGPPPFGDVHQKLVKRLQLVPLCFDRVLEHLRYHRAVPLGWGSEGLGTGFAGCLVVPIFVPQLPQLGVRGWVLTDQQRIHPLLRIFRLSLLELIDVV
mmetsp:Transcript_35344/g.92433  ORF Transcript_35344/g.92433 Transcript_35344/m.92433 type:complete len:201 (-) Transcript_35344:1604-2206(-)